MAQGRVLGERSVASRYLGAKRTVRIYLPPSYDHAPRRRFPVLYVHDGQNVFGSANPHRCFGWGGWELDRIVSRLCGSHQMQEIIMVAIDNSPARYGEYRGPVGARANRKLGVFRKLAVLKHKLSAGGGNPRFENYARFLCKELKPQIDRDFRTLPTAANTGVLGASLGGICSLALAWEHPRTFGLVASLSGAFQVEKKHFLENALGGYKGKRKPLKIYLDSGAVDYTGDDDGRKDTAAVATELRRLGWRDDLNLRHFVDAKPMTEDELEQAGLWRDKWNEARHSQHNEFYWRLRVWRALVFLFPPIRTVDTPFPGPRSTL